MPLSPGQALALAKRTRHRVAIPAMTTATSTTSANPSGTLTTSETLQPVRVRRDGTWKALNSTLRRGPDGRISPEATSNGLELSGGGTAWLAIITADARTLTMSWPTPLPAPTLSGSIATYAGVWPGVNLVVTVDDQGGFSDTLVVQSAAAAANPALDSISTGLATPLALSTDSAGDLFASVSPDTPPMISVQAPEIWDSTPPPAGMPTVTEPGGLVVNADNGLPAYSSATAPGSAAHVATVPDTLSGNVLTLTPSASLLTGSGITYPVYIDPNWYDFAGSQADAWTQVDSGFPSQSYWHESSDLQSGDCYDSPAGSCNGMGVARSFFQLPIPSQLYSTTHIDSAYVHMTEDWAPSCTPTSVRLYTTGGIFSSTTWNHQPTWASSYSYQDVAYGYPGCPYKSDDITWDVTSTIASVEGHQTTQTWGLRAADESDTGEWKKFWSGSKNITLSVTYNYTPNAPTNLSTSPGGSCQTSSSDPAQIGDDEVTFSAYASDNDGDDNLTTRFVIYNTNGTTAYDSASEHTNVATGDKADAELTLPSTTIQDFNKDGQTTAYTYYWQAQTTNDANLTSGWSSECWFTYNPTGPQQPSVTSTTTNFVLGQPANFTFTTPNCGIAPNGPCPVSYTYQLGSGNPVTVTDNAPQNGWNGSIVVSREGAEQLSVYGTSAGGNLSEAADFPFASNAPTTSYPDGYFHGGSYPDVLTAGSGTKPSLWLSTGSGNGTLNPPVDVGSLGTGINSGDDGPADWAGADILHGEFINDKVQDVMAYYPQGTANSFATAGSGVIIGGTGDQSTLEPDSGNTYTIPAGTLTDSDLCNLDGEDCPVPTDLVAAGDASGSGTGLNDLIGILGNSSSYELALFTNQDAVGDYGGVSDPDGTALSDSAPGNDSWQNYTLATAQPGCYPGSVTTCNQSSVTLFALDTSTGQLWDTTVAEGSIGSWARFTSVPWGSKPPALLSADINAAGQTELWTGASATTIDSYTVSGAALTEENTDPVNAPFDEWPLTDGSTLAHPGATTATDTTGGNTAALTGSATWGADDYFSTDISLNGQPGYLSPPSTTIPSTDTTPKISIWFKTTTPDQVLVSLQQDALSTSATTTGSYDPVLYIGHDGHLCAEWWNGSTAPIESTIQVDDGLWHHAILTMYANSQTLYLDNQPSQNLPGGFTGTTTNLDFGAGYIGGNWPDEIHQQPDNNTGYLEYFNGQIADPIFSYPGGP
jgi:hypothetical protein